MQVLEFETDNLGHIHLDNRWTVSIQTRSSLNPFIHSDENSAEIWSWKKENNYPSEPLHYQTPEEIREFIDKVKNFD